MIQFQKFFLTIGTKFKDFLIKKTLSSIQQLRHTKMAQETVGVNKRATAFPFYDRKMYKQKNLRRRSSITSEECKNQQME